MEVIHLFHLDFWRAKVQDNKNRIFMTDVTTDDVTITMIESCNGDGFFKELWSGRILKIKDNFYTVTSATGLLPTTLNTPSKRISYSILFNLN